MQNQLTSEELKAYLKASKSQGKPSKYKNKFVKVQEKQPDGVYKNITFHSVKEKAYYDDLCYRQRAGQIKDFARQKHYKLAVNGVHICKYISDFVVMNNDGSVEVIDVKSDYTRKMRMYQIKKALMLAVHRINIVEV